MSDYTQKDMSGVLFKNERKNPGEDYPDYQGSVTVKGVKFGVGGWIKKSKTGKNYMSLSVRPWKEPQKKTSSSQASNDFEDDPLPF